MNWMVLPNQVCLIVKLYNNRPELLPDSNELHVLIELLSKKSVELTFYLNGGSRITFEQIKTVLHRY